MTAAYFVCGMQLLFITTHLPSYLAICGMDPMLGAQALGIVTVFSFVFVLSYATFWAIKKTYGLRVSEEEEDAGLDISEHGMYGYPEQFIPTPELVGYGAAPHVTTPVGAGTMTTPKEVTA